MGGDPVFDMTAAYRAEPQDVLAAMGLGDTIPDGVRERAVARATELVRRLRENSDPGLMETFLSEYGLSTDEGVALMCLAEALLRVPDAETVDALIEDKIAPSEWGAHLGKSSSPLVNASTWGLMLTGKVLGPDESRGTVGLLRGLVKRLGEPVIRVAVGRAMKEMGRQFVLGETITGALKRAEAPYTYSYDMLGEAAMTATDAERYFDSYYEAIVTLGKQAKSPDIRRNPGISIKLSALHPRYDELQRERVLVELVPKVRVLATLAAEQKMGLNIDAEESERLELSLDVFDAIIGDNPGWGGLGMVVQAYGKRAGFAIDRVAGIARNAGERCMVRLVKGAYWDTEIKRAQVDGVDGFPVFDCKAETDTAYMLGAVALLRATPEVYPQFATHNAHTVAFVLEAADALGVAREAFEFQRLHGMGEALHGIVVREERVACRVYAPVGEHRDLLAYLVRRLLENGANSSFVSQVLDGDVPVERVVRDPLEELAQVPNFAVRLPDELFGARRNSRGWDLRERSVREAFAAAREPFRETVWEAAPIVVSQGETKPPAPVINPARPGDVVGHVRDASADMASRAIADAVPWDAPVAERAAVLREAADMLEANSGEIFALLAREAGKIALDVVGELREAVDFLRYYADEAERRGELEPAGTVVAISPWNFPLAIFAGQIAAALAMGNAVVAKPAETTPLIAHRCVEWMHAAGVPVSALQFVPGTGAEVGRVLTAAPGVDGVVFTGSTGTAQAINRSMAKHLDPAAFLIAETGGINAMIVDSTALPEQAVRDIVAGAFQSAGQRCSALRCLYVQDDVADSVLEMLEGAMRELRMGDPWELSTDVGPVITAEARDDQFAYLKGQTLRARLAEPEVGYFVPPAIIEVGGIGEVEREVFGPVLHVARFAAEDLLDVVEAVNATGFGLTFGLHSRIDDRVEAVSRRIHAGNVYVNRNQIGAVVESQPFGGEGLSGTGPKAGGPHYLDRFAKADRVEADRLAGRRVTRREAQGAIDALPDPELCALETRDMPGPTGESNRLSLFARGRVLCLGADVDMQAGLVELTGCTALRITPGADGAHAVDGVLPPEYLRGLDGFCAVVFWGDANEARAYRSALAAREGAILPLVLGRDVEAACRREKHVCVDTTAAGGNASLLAAVGGDADV